MEQQIERIGGGVDLYISEQHTFGTDAFLLSHFAAPRKRDLACDLGTGCGVVPLLWFREEEGPRLAYGLDIQPEAVVLLGKSVKESGLEDRVLPVLADLRAIGKRGSRKAWPDFPAGEFTLVTCNPPYNAAGTGLLSEKLSDRVARHETLCTLDDVCAAAARLLRYGGRFCICHLPERLVDLMEAMRVHRLEPKRLRMVQQTADDAPWLVLVEAKLGAKPSLKVEKPLIMREDEGESDEMRYIYRMYGRV